MIARARLEAGFHLPPRRVELDRGLFRSKADGARSRFRTAGDGGVHFLTHRLERSLGQPDEPVLRFVDKSRA